MEQESVSGDWAVQLDRYVANECSAEEALAIGHWVAADPARQRLVETLRQHRRMLQTDVIRTRESHIERRFAAVERDIAKAAHVSVSSPAPIRNRIAVGLAAVMVLALGFGIVRRLPHWTSVEQTYATASGERSAIRLADGTRMILGPASRLLVQVARDGGRHVQLEGEAFFQVTHDAAHPFMVTVGKTVVRDVGTQFDVRGYAGDPTMHVAVAEGEVCIDIPCRGQSLRAGDVAVITGHHILVTHRASVESYTAWTQGRLAFDNTPLRDVAAQLSRWYGINIQVIDSTIANRPLTATFTTQSIADVLEVVARAAAVHVEINGRKVVIRAGQAAVSNPQARRPSDRFAQQSPSDPPSSRTTE